MGTHPHIALILGNAQRYREGRLSIEGLQQSLSAVMSALEGDVPKEIHDAVRKAEGWVDSIRFTMNEADRSAEVGRVLDELEGVVHRFYR
jgi:hypothetical protein